MPGPVLFVEDESILILDSCDFHNPQADLWHRRGEILVTAPGGSP